MSTKAAQVLEPQVEIAKFKAVLESSGLSLDQVQTQVKDAERILPTLEPAMQYAGDVATRFRLRPTTDTGSLHSSAIVEMDTFVEVSILAPKPLEGTIWNVGENALITVQIRSSYLPLRNAVLHLGVTGPAQLIPFPVVPPKDPSNWYFAEIKPGITQAAGFCAHALAAGTASFSAELFAEVVPCASRFPASRMATIAPK